MHNMKSAAKKNAMRKRGIPRPKKTPEQKAAEQQAKQGQPEQPKRRPIAADLDFEASPKQGAFIETSQNPAYGFPDKILYGGAAGGGKTWTQVVDAFYYAQRYRGSRQVIFRRTFPELDRSVIVEWMKIVPDRFSTYNASEHRAYFANGSVVEFAHLEREESVYNYKSAEYDVIRFEEASEFTPFQLNYMASRCRGANEYPHQIKYTTNPGGPGHKYLKQIFQIGVTEALKIFYVYIGDHPLTGERLYEKRVFIPALVYENPKLLAMDPGYLTRMMQLPDKEREMLLSGNWDIADDSAFKEFDPRIHVCKTFKPPEHWTRWRSVDNGYQDPFAWYWYAVSEDGTVYVYREYTRDPDNPDDPNQKDKVHYSDQASQVKLLSSHVDAGTMSEMEERFSYTVAGHDAWFGNVRDEQGKTLIDYYRDGGVTGFIKAITDRRLRCAVIHEYLKPFKGPDGRDTARIQIMDCCKKLIETLPEQLIDPTDSEKYAESKTDHWTDSFGYGILSYHSPKSRPTKASENSIKRHKREYARRMQE